MPIPTKYLLPPGFVTVAGACADAATEKNPNTSVRTECKCLTIKFYIM